MYCEAKGAETILILAILMTAGQVLFYCTGWLEVVDKPEEGSGSLGSLEGEARVNHFLAHNLPATS